MPEKGQAGSWRRAAQILSAVAAILMALLFVGTAFEAYECHHDPNCDDYMQLNYWGLLIPAMLLGSAAAALFRRRAWPLVAAWGAIGAWYLGVALYLLIPSVQKALGLPQSPMSVVRHMLHDPWVWAWLVVFLLAISAVRGQAGQRT